VIENFLITFDYKLFKQWSQFNLFEDEAKRRKIEKNAKCTNQVTLENRKQKIYFK
jgi:hypothetical protein